MYAAALEGSRDTILESLGILASPLSDLSSLSSAKNDILTLLKSLPEGDKLHVQFKSLFPRFYCTFSNPTTLHTFLQFVAQSSHFRESSLKLLQVVGEERGDAFMCSSIQIALFAILKLSLSALAANEEDPLEKLPGRKKKDKTGAHRIRTQFLRLMATVSQSYEKFPLCLVDNTEAQEWKEEYSTELLPLIDLFLDNLRQFEMAEIKPITSIVSNFCRFVKSNDPAVDGRIRIIYNEWVNECLPTLSLEKPAAEVAVDLRVVSRLLKNEKGNASHMGIRNLVEMLVKRMAAGEEDAMMVLGVSVVCSYLLAYDVFVGAGREV